MTLITPSLYVSHVEASGVGPQPLPAQGLQETPLQKVLHARRHPGYNLIPPCNSSSKMQESLEGPCQDASTTQGGLTCYQ